MPEELARAVYMLMMLIKFTVGFRFKYNVEEDPELLAFNYQLWNTLQHKTWYRRVAECMWMTRRFQVRTIRDDGFTQWDFELGGFPTVSVGIDVSKTYDYADTMKAVKFAGAQLDGFLPLFELMKKLEVRDGQEVP